MNKPMAFPQRAMLFCMITSLAGVGLIVPAAAHDTGRAAGTGAGICKYASGRGIYQVYIQPPRQQAAPPANGPIAPNFVLALCEKQAPLGEACFKLRPRRVTRLVASVGAMLHGQPLQQTSVAAAPRERLTVFDFELLCDDVPVVNAGRTVMMLEGRTLAIRDRNLAAGFAKPAGPVQPIAHTVAWPLLARNSQQAVAQLYPNKTPSVIADPSSGSARLVLWPDLRERKLLPAWTMTLRSTNRTQPFLRRYWVTATQPVRILDYEDLIFYQQPAVPQPRLADAGSLLPGTFVPTRPQVAKAAAGEAPTASASVIFAGAASGTVTATMWETSPYGRVVTRPMPNLEVTVTRPIIGPVTTLTDPAGRFAVNGVNGTANLSATLSGPACRVINDQAGTQKEDLARFSNNGGAVTVDFYAAPGDESRLAQTTAFYCVNQAYDFVRGYTPERGTKLSRLQTHVNLDSSCNAYYDRTDGTLNFFLKGGSSESTCPNTAYRDVIYHEYGHAVDDELGGIVDSAYSEGFGDALAMLMTHQPFVGQDFYGPGKHLRDARKVFLWPKVKDEEIHKAGQAYSGYCWELVQQLQTAYGSDKAYEIGKQLIMGAAVQNPKDIPDAVRLMFFTDAQLYPTGTGSQNAAYIRAAARSRQLPIPAEAGNLSSPDAY